MVNQSQPLQYAAGDIVTFRLSPGLVVASAFVSFIGSVITVEQLHRKNVGKGWINWLQRLGVSISFGLVAIWCMHSVGNRAIILGDGRESIQLAYDPGFTALSVVLPIVFLFVGLTLGEFLVSGNRGVWTFLFVGGFIVGLSITGMHYIGNLGISNYKLHNPPQYIVGAATIAVCASIAALALFCYLKSQWVDSWPRRIACATLLTLTVSGMHWLATVGTTYTLIQPDDTHDNRNVNLVVAIICGLLSCIICLVFIVITQRRKRKLADRAQHVVLASATFDSDGRLLVTTEGLPPSRKVTKQFNQKSFDDEFNVAHPVFQWLFRVTFNWPGVSELVPGMRSHLRAVGIMKDRPSRPSSADTSSPSDDGEVGGDYSVIFREYFCVAADELAASLDIPLSDLGVLYNGILTTGSNGKDIYGKKTRIKGDLESGLSYPRLFGRGQLLFVVRWVDKIEAGRLKSAGYRFANVNNVAPIIAQAMRAPQAEIEDTIERLRLYAQPRENQDTEAGTYLACFAIRAAVKAAKHSWEILVPTNQPGELPKVKLSQTPLLPWQKDALVRLDGLSISQSIGYLNNTASECNVVTEKEFLEHLLDQITQLTRQVPEDFFKQAVFCGQPVTAPGLGDDRSNLSPQVYAFCIIPDVHTASVKSTSVTYIPLSFFQCIQRVYKRSPDHAILAQRIHREFGAILSHKDVAAAGTRHGPKQKDRRSSRLSIPSVSFSKTGTPRESVTPAQEFEFSEQASEKISDDTRRSESTMAPPIRPFGGIMVSSDTKVEVHSKTDNMELENMGSRAEAGVATSEAPTYVDELFKIASSRWQRQ